VTIEERVQRIPGHLLLRSRDPGRDKLRALELEAFCEARNFRPTFYELELERRRRCGHASIPLEEKTR
jgi:hypothetical protein